MSSVGGGGRPVRYGCLAVAFLALWGVLVTAWAQAPDKKDADRRIYLYQGADREQRLIAGAKQEGVLNLYTSMQVPDAAPITQAFEKKYGVKTTVWRASGEKIVQRAVAETRAGRFELDVAETDGAQVEILYREKLLAPFYTPHAKDIPPAIIPAHKHYVPTRVTLYVFVYNTKLVAPNEVPNSYEDLLLPKWAGKVGIEAEDVPWFGSVVKAMGEKRGLNYFQKLAASKPAVRKGHTLLAELIAAGEIAMAPDAHIQGVERLKKRGAPVDWKPLQPAFGQPSSIGLLAHAPHPHAALLFADFLLSPEGQEIIKSRNRVPVSRAVENVLGKFDYALIDPVIVLDEWERWEKPWSELFLKGQRVQKSAE